MRAAETISYWHGAGRQRKICRFQRRRACLRHLDGLSDFCSRHGVAMLQVQHGYQFRLREYIINWSPTTNKVKIQYCLPGNGQTVDFKRNGQPNKPRILVALEEMVDRVLAKP